MVPSIKFSRNKELTMNENFAGIGAFKKGFERAGFKVKVVAISEIDKYCIASYKEMHGEVSNLGAIGSFERLPAGVDVCTWSFPCQDISNAGQGKGMEEGTKSNYGFVFLETLRNTPIEERPKVLIMENVALLFSKKFHRYWVRILAILSECGYQNYPGKMNAKDYGVAQNRDRIFIVSTLGHYSYEFPKPFKLEKKLKEYLEPNVDEKFYLSAKMLKYVLGDSNGWIRQFRPLEKDSESSYTITTREGNVAESTYIQEPLFAYGPQKREFDGFKPIAHTLRATDYKTPNIVLIPEKTKKKYAEATDGDGIYINRPHQKRGTVQKSKIHTIKTSPDDIGVVETFNEEMEELKLIYDLGMFGVYEDNDGRAFLMNRNGQLARIRKVTPRESWRLMDFTDEDFDKAQRLNSNTQLYKQAGNSIVVGVVEEIAKMMME
jgi:DNA (cytosine-5)-methyltransferase 1